MTTSAIRGQLVSEQSISETFNNNNDLLNPMPEDHDIQGIQIQQNFHLSSWFSITTANTCTFPGINYGK